MSDETCEPCQFAVGIGMITNICNELNAKGFNLDCNNLSDKVINEIISVKKFTKEMEQSIRKTKDKQALEAFIDIKSLMYEK